MRSVNYWILATTLAVMAGGTSFASDVAENLPAYQKVQGVGGNLDSIESDTRNNLMTHWAEDFAALYPIVHIPIEGKDSSRAPSALTHIDPARPIAHNTGQRRPAGEFCAGPIRQQVPWWQKRASH